MPLHAAGIEVTRVQDALSVPLGFPASDLHLDFVATPGGTPPVFEVWLLSGSGGYSDVCIRGVSRIKVRCPGLL